MTIDSDLAAALKGWGSSAVLLAGVTTRGLLDYQDAVQVYQGDPVQVRQTVLRLVRSEFLNADGSDVVARGDTVTVDDTDYQVTEVLVGEQDGRELHLTLRKV